MLLHGVSTLLASTRGARPPGRARGPDGPDSTDGSRPESWHGLRRRRRLEHIALRRRQRSARSERVNNGAVNPLPPKAPSLHASENSSPEAAAFRCCEREEPSRGRRRLMGRCRKPGRGPWPCVPARRFGVMLPAAKGRPRYACRRITPRQKRVRSRRASGSVRRGRPPPAHSTMNRSVDLHLSRNRILRMGGLRPRDRAGAAPTFRGRETSAAAVRRTPEGLRACPRFD